MVLGLISAVWSIINFVLNLLQFADFIAGATTIILNFTSYLPTLNTWLGYVYFFIPPSVLYPLLAFSLLTSGVRIGFAIVNLIWW